MRTSKAVATLITAFSSPMCITSLAYADDSATKAKNEDVARYIDLVSVGSPVTKIAFRTNETETSLLNFTPGPGVGYTWKEGAVGVFFYPSVTLQNNTKDLSIAPHVTINFLYLINLGIGYEWQWKENNAGKSGLHSRAPILTLGISVPLKVLNRFKL